MILPKFDYQAPESISAACSLLSQAGGRAAVMAGGTDLIVRMKQGIVIPTLLVGLKMLPELEELSYSETGGLRIGSMVSLQKLGSSPVVKESFPVLAEAVSLVGAAQQQFMGTVGGNLCLDTRCCYYNQPEQYRRSIPPCHKLGGETCHTVKGANRCYAVYSADLGSVLFALGASIAVAGSKGTKVVPLEKFFSGDPAKPINLQKDELITEIIVPPEKPGFARYYKLRQRNTLDFPQMGVTLVAFPDVQEYRIVVNAVAGSPLRFKDLEAMLSKEKLSENLVADFAAKIVSRVKPMANVSGSPAYRRKMVGILVKKAFLEMGVIHE